MKREREYARAYSQPDVILDRRILSLLVKLSGYRADTGKTKSFVHSIVFTSMIPIAVVSVICLAAVAYRKRKRPYPVYSDESARDLWGPPQY